MNYQEYLDTPYWKQVSVLVKASAGGRCQVCNSDHNLMAHHRTYANRGKELDHLEDLTCLCGRCHQLFHTVERDERMARPIVPKQETPSYKEPTLNDKRTGTRVLNREMIATLRVKGGMSSATVKALGLDWSFTRKNGWMNRLVGRVITEEAYQNALAGKRIRKKV